MQFTKFSKGILTGLAPYNVDFGSLKRYPVRKLFATRWNSAGILLASTWDSHKDLTRILIGNLAFLKRYPVTLR